MRHPAVSLLTVTGGEGVVHAAMQSGKRAICAGPGNPPVVVDETADIDEAGRDIVRGASFDNNIVCIVEKETFAVATVAEALKRSMLAHGAYRDRCRSAGAADEGHLHPGAAAGEGRPAEQGLDRQERLPCCSRRSASPSATRSA